MSLTDALTEKAIELGAAHCGTVAITEVHFDPALRKECEANFCGGYGKNYMCPPDVGKIEDLIADAKTYESITLFQTISPLEDSFDVEGMQEASKNHDKVVDGISDYLRSLPDAPRHLILGAGGCRLCPVCGKVTGTPCRFPDRAHSSLEAYGIFVAKLAKKCGMKYINGQNTVTYFGAVLL